MLPLLKILLFPLFAAGIGLAGYVIYRYFNEKIISSRSLGALLFYTCLLIAINAGLALFGIIALITVYDWLS